MLIGGHEIDYFPYGMWEPTYVVLELFSCNVLLRCIRARFRLAVTKVTTTKISVVHISDTSLSKDQMCCLGYLSLNIRRTY